MWALDWWAQNLQTIKTNCQHFTKSFKNKVKMSHPVIQDTNNPSLIS